MDTPVHQEPVVVPERAVVIVEGMFLHRDELTSYWDLSIFLQVPFTVTAQRMAERDSTHPDHPSLARYIQGQRRYLSTCNPTTRATYVLDNS
jgi:uridine kinase